MYRKRAKRQARVLRKKDPDYHYLALGEYKLTETGMGDILRVLTPPPPT
jgi:hypothetical protein